MGGGNKEPWIVFRLSILLALFAPAGNQVSCNHVWEERKQNKRKKNQKNSRKSSNHDGRKYYICDYC